MRLKKIGTTLTALVTVAALIFLAKTLLNYQDQARDFLIATPPVKMIAAFCLFLGHLYLRAMSWRSLVFFLGSSVNRTNSFTIWFFSEATRYIPIGKIWSFASRAYLAQQKRIPPKTAFLILPVEVIIVTATVAILSLYAIIQTIERLPFNLTFYIGVATSLSATLGLLFLHKVIKKVLNRLAIQAIVPKALFTALLLQAASWSLYSIGYIALADIAKVPDLVLFFSATLLAWLVGYLTIVSPMGLGVRESAFILLAGQQIGTGQAAVVALLARTILIVAELSNLAFWAILKRRLK